MYKVGRFIRCLQNGAVKHLPTLLTTAGAVLSGVGMFCAAKGALEANKRIAEYEASKGSTDISTKEVVKVSAPCYVPAAICYAGSVACLVGAHRISAARLIAAISSAMAAEKTLRENREAVKEVFNKKGLVKVDQFLNETKGAQIYSQGGHVYETGHGNTLCCESYLTGVMFRASPEWIYKCVNDYNALINEGEDPSMTVFIELLLPDLPTCAIPEYSDNLHMPIDQVTMRQELMRIQLDSDLTDTGEPFLVFTQTITPETRSKHSNVNYLA